MPRNVNGVQTMLKAGKTICRMVGRFGVDAVEVELSAELAAAFLAVQTACMALDALDDYVGQIDRTEGGYQDGVPA